MVRHHAHSIRFDEGNPNAVSMKKSICQSFYNFVCFFVF